MGNLATLMTRPNDELVSATTHPSRSDWITAHAAATGLSVLEVERLWLRFQQLGCTKDGVVTDAILKQKAAWGQDAFLRNLMIKLKNSPTPEGVVFFQAFLNTMNWMEIASIEDKLRACFCLVNNGNPWDRRIFSQVLTKVFPNDTQQGHERLTEALFAEVCQDRPDEISEEEFIAYCHANFSNSLLHGLLAYVIIPEAVTMEAQSDLDLGHVTPSPAPKKKAARVDLGIEAAYTIPTDGQLEAVAAAVAQKDYRLLGNKLGFFESDMSHTEQLFPGDSRKQVLHLLREWRRRDGSHAYVITLQKCLQEARFPGVAVMLLPR